MFVLGKRNSNLKKFYRLKIHFMHFPDPVKSTILWLCCNMLTKNDKSSCIWITTTATYLEGSTDVYKVDSQGLRGARRQTGCPPGSCTPASVRRRPCTSSPQSWSCRWLGSAPPPVAGQTNTPSFKHTCLAITLSAFTSRYSRRNDAVYMPRLAGWDCNRDRQDYEAWCDRYISTYSPCLFYNRVFLLILLLYFFNQCF